MKIDRKTHVSEIINNNDAELYFDNDDNTLCIQMKDGKYQIKQNSHYYGPYNLKQIIKNEKELSTAYPAQIGITYAWNLFAGDELTLIGANAYMLYDGTIYSDKRKDEPIVHQIKSHIENFYIIYYFEDTESTGEAILNYGDIYDIVIQNFDFSKKWEQNTQNCCINGLYGFAEMSIELINTKIPYDNTKQLIKILGGNSFYYENVTFKGFNFSSLTKIGSLFNNMDNMTYDLKFLNCNFKTITDFSNMFRGCYELTSMPLLDTSNGTNFDSMFNGCGCLETIAQLNTSNGTNFNYMFYRM